MQFLKKMFSYFANLFDILWADKSRCTTTRIISSQNIFTYFNAWYRISSSLNFKSEVLIIKDTK